MKKNYLLALLSAILMTIAWPPNTWLAPLLLIGLVPLFVALNNITQQKSNKSGKRIFLTAGLTFLLWNTASIYWVFNAINTFNAGVTGTIIALLVSLIPYGLGALLMTFAFWLFYQLSLNTSKKVAYLGLICFYVSTEYLHQTWDLAFPWMTLGNGFASMHQLAQWYEYTGVYGGSIWILLSNILIFETYSAWRLSSPQKITLTTISLATLIMPIGFSLYMYNNYQEKSVPTNVVVVQPNVDPYQKYGSITPQDQLNNLIQLSDSVAQMNTEYFIWPETALPNYVDEDQIRSDANFLQAQQFLNKYKL